MAGSLTTDGADKALDYLIDDYYLALYTDAETEVTGGAYARLKLHDNMAAAVAGSKANEDELVFPVATAEWGEITHFAVVSTAEGAGTVTWSGELDVKKTIEVNDQWAAGPGELVFSQG